MAIEQQLAALHRALTARAEFRAIRRDAFRPLPTTGLAHDHVAIAGTGLLLRVPKQSQLALDAAANLAYQAACFERASASGHTPRLHGVLAPGPELAMGALVVDHVDGRPARLPADLGAIATALAAIHRLPLPAAGRRPPLQDQAEPIGATLAEVAAQAAYLDGAGLDPDARAAIGAELDWAQGFAAALGAPTPVSLISFDAHPGNFLVDRHGEAVLVDLEKALYGAPGYDLAHATLYTSTTWDVARSAVLTTEQVAAFYRRWLACVAPAMAAASRPWLMALRRIMWLWSVTWCAKWRVESAAAARHDKHTARSTEDWSAELSDPALVAHVADRVADYLDPATIARVRAEWRTDNSLSRMLPAPVNIP